MLVIVPIGSSAVTDRLTVLTHILYGPPTPCPLPLTERKQFAGLQNRALMSLSSH